MQRVFWCVSVCARVHFTQQGSFPGRGLGTTVAAEEQLSNLSPCLPEVFSLFFPNKLKLKEKEVTFPSPNWILLCPSLEITLSRFSFHYLHISYQKYTSLCLSKSVPLNRIHCPDFYVTATSNQGQCWQAANSYSLLSWRNWDHCPNNRRTKQTTFPGPEYLEFIYTAVREKEMSTTT